MLLFGGIWNTFGLCTKKVIGHFKQDLMEHLSMRMEESHSENDLNCEAKLRKVQRGRTLVCGLKIILMTFWQKIQLLF